MAGHATWGMLYHTLRAYRASGTVGRFVHTRYRGYCPVDLGPSFPWWVPCTWDAHWGVKFWGEYDAGWFRPGIVEFYCSIPTTAKKERKKERGKKKRQTEMERGLNSLLFRQDISSF